MNPDSLEDSIADVCSGLGYSLVHLVDYPITTFVSLWSKVDGPFLCWTWLEKGVKTTKGITLSPQRRLEGREPYFGTNTMKPFALIFTILASVSVGLHGKKLGSQKTMYTILKAWTDLMSLLFATILVTFQYYLLLTYHTLMSSTIKICTLSWNICGCEVPLMLCLPSGHFDVCNSGLAQ